MFAGIDHLCLDVSDMEKARCFYIGLLGFRQRGDELVRGRTKMRTIFLERDGVVIELKCPTAGPVEPRPQPGGFCPCP